jgi:hypothetical protein
MIFDRNAVGEKVVNQALANYWKELESMRVDDAQRLYRWYFNDRDGMLNDIKTAMLVSFREKTVNRMNLRARNIVPKVVNKLCQVYKLPAIRKIDGGSVVVIGKDGVASETQPKSDEVYQLILDGSTINTKSKSWEKLGFLFNTVLVQPRVVRIGKGDPFLDFIIHTPAYCAVMVDEDNWNIPTAFYYPIESTIRGKQQQVLVYWSSTEHYMIDKLGNIIAPGNNPDKVNPYGILPIAVLRFSESGDFWGEGRWQLVDGSIESSIQYSNIGYTSLFQTHGQAVAINTGLIGEPEVGPDHIIKIENAGREGAQPSDFKFASPNPQIAAVQSLNDWYIKTLQTDEGLNPQQFATETNLKSGTAKMLDNADIDELREDHRQILENFEHDLFDICRKIWNIEGNSRIPEQSEFTIEFSEPKVEKTVDEKVKERESAIKLGIGSRVDFIREDNPEMTDDQATEKLQQIILENRQWEDKYGLFDNLTQGNQQQNNLQNSLITDQGLQPGNGQPPFMKGVQQNVTQ